MKILITGASGLLGTAMIREWSPRHSIVPLSHEDIELEDPAGIEKIIEEARPDVVVHTAAWTDVDGCERDPARATRVNAIASGRIAAASGRVGAACVYISTDSVFEGSRGNYSESDVAEPVNLYSKSKLDGEREVLAQNSHAIVARVSLEGWRPNGKPGFVHWVVQGLERGERLTICTDWIRSVVFAPNVATALETMWNARLSGVFHVAPPESISNFDLATMTAEVFGLDASGLVPISGDSLKLSARRPKNTSLNNHKLTAAVGPVVGSIRDGLIAMKRNRAD